MSARAATIRGVLLVVGTLLVIAGLISSFAYNWNLVALLYMAAFLCKWGECWLLERALVDSEAVS